MKLNATVVKALKQVGYKGTAEDLKTFQAARGLTATGEADARTRAALVTLAKHDRKHPASTFLMGEKDQKVLAAEQRLRTLGYATGAVDGVFDKVSAAALVAFKKDHPQLKSSSTALAADSQKLLGHEVSSRAHAPQHLRVRPSRAWRRLDAATQTAVTRPRTDGLAGLGVGDGKSRAVKNIELRLKAAGYSPQKSDGVFDARTESAVKSYQRHAGLPVTGRVDAKTWSKLKSANLYAKDGTSPAQALGERSGAVKRSEQWLKKLGFKVGRADGLFDRSTQRAIRSFERKHKGLTQDGKISARDLQQMKKDLQGTGKKAFEVAKGLLGRSAVSLQTRGPIAKFMHDGVPANVNCANFVSSCLEKAGLIDRRQHSDLVSGLARNLRDDRDWKRVSLKHAKPGDVCVVNSGGHVVMFAGRDSSGRPLFIGSNNRMWIPGHPQYVSVKGGYSPIEIFQHKG